MEELSENVCFSPLLAVSSCCQEHFPAVDEKGFL